MNPKSMATTSPVNLLVAKNSISFLLSNNPVFIPNLRALHFSPLHNSKQNSPKSPFVPSLISCSSLASYLRLYSTLIFSKCLGSQWKRTRRLTSNSVRSLDVSPRAWWRSKASLTGRLRTPLRMCARVSPYVDSDQ